VDCVSGSVIHISLHLFFIFHRSKLGHNEHKDVEIVILLNISSMNINNAYSKNIINHSRQ
jgi:hypothetical protein